MKTSPPDRISVSLALQALQEASDEVYAAQLALDRARAVRDDLIRSARDSGIPLLRLARITKLSRERLYKITHSGSEPKLQYDEEERITNEEEQ